MNGAQIAMALNRVSPALSFRASRTAIQVRKNMPHIAFGVGLAASVTSTVLACRATLKLHDTMDEVEKDIDYARAHDRDITYAYVKGASKILRLYGPAIGVGLGGIGCLSGAHIDLTRRNTALMAAYVALQDRVASDRARVLDSDSGDSERADHSGPVTLINGRSQYARLFDEYNMHWEKDAETNRFYLQVQQNYFNDILHARGHLFLNEVYDRLGFEHSKEGAIVGWVVKNPNGTGDGYVTFGLDAPGNEDFMEGRERSVWLDFNVDGVVFDLI